MKKRIAILYAGQIRSNSLSSIHVTNDNSILESIESYFLNEKFKEKYDYDIFISIDEVDIEKTLDFFGKDNVKNIHLIENNYYLNPIQNTIPNHDYFFQKYQSLDFHGLQRFPNNHMQCYRLYDVYNLLCNYQADTNTKYDYIMRCRPDVKYIKDIAPLFEMIDNLENCQLVCDDVNFIGKIDIMKLFLTIVDGKYGTYGLRDTNKYEWTSFLRERHFYYNNYNNYEYTYSPEVQMTECFFEYCYKLGLSIDETLYGKNGYSIIYNRHLFEL